MKVITNLKKLIAWLPLLTLLPLLTFASWEMDFDEDWAAASVHTLDVQSYVGWGTGELVGMWDGIRNVGATLDHDGSSVTWKDLVGAGAPNITMQDKWSFIESGVSVTNESRYTTYTAHFLNSCVDGMTIEFAVRLDSIGMSKSWLTGTALGQGFGISITSSTKKIGVTQGSAYATFCLTDVSTYVGSGTPFTYTATLDNTTTNIQGYLNGVFGSEGKGTKKVTAGYFGVNGTPWENVGFCGRFYSIRVYNRVLTPAEIAANYETDKKRFGIP